MMLIILTDPLFVNYDTEKDLIDCQVYLLGFLASATRSTFANT